MNEAENLFKDANGLDVEAATKQDVDTLREELLKLAEDGELNHKPAAVKKAGEKVLRKWRAEVGKQRAKKANEFLTDLVISKFAGLLGGLHAIEDSETLEKDLQRDALLKRDVMRVVETISPYIPVMGLLSGGVTVASHVYSKNNTASTTTNVET